jgi:hypothetical protein
MQLPGIGSFNEDEVVGLNIRINDVASLQVARGWGPACSIAMAPLRGALWLGVGITLSL